MLTSEDLRNVGYLPNNSLQDQRLALLLIKRYSSCAGFGGDPGKVTVAGESAGAVSCY